MQTILTCTVTGSLTRPERSRSRRSRSLSPAWMPARGGHDRRHPRLPLTDGTHGARARHVRRGSPRTPRWPRWCSASNTVLPRPRRACCSAHPLASGPASGCSASRCSRRPTYSTGTFGSGCKTRPSLRPNRLGGQLRSSAQCQDAPRLCRSLSSDIRQCGTCRNEQKSPRSRRAVTSALLWPGVSLMRQDHPDRFFDYLLAGHGYAKGRTR
jgi:hypothetical protein